MKSDSTSKITNTKRIGDVVQVIESLPSKCKILNLTPSTAKKKITEKYCSFFP
jgi:hypothetical protein